MIDGVVYVGNTVGKSKSLNKSTIVLPVKSETVVPASIPPTSVSISNVDDKFELYMVSAV